MGLHVAVPFVEGGHGHRRSPVGLWRVGFRQASAIICTLTHMQLICIKSRNADRTEETGVVALGDAILACLTERPMTGYELAKTFDSSIGFFWKADHQQIYRELSRLRDRGHIQGREVVQSGKPNKLVYTLTSEGRAALRHWAARPSSPAFDQGRSLVRLYALDSVDIEPLRTDLMARLEHHRDRCARYERILNKRFPARHRFACGYRQAARPAHRAAPRAGGGGVVRRGARCLVGHLAGAQECRAADRRPARKQRTGRAPAARSRRYVPGPKHVNSSPSATLRPGRPRFLNPLFTVTRKSRSLRQTTCAEFDCLFNRDARGG